MTEWLDDHPGGREIIENNKSKDVTPIFNPRHPSDQLDEENLPPTVQHLGQLDVESASDEDKAELRLKVNPEAEEEESRLAKAREDFEEKGLGVVVNMRDFEVRPPKLSFMGGPLTSYHWQKFAEPMLSKVCLAYYQSAGDDEISK